MAIEAGADDVTFDDDTVEIFGPVESFKEISEGLKSIGVNPEEAELRMFPNNEVELPPVASIQVVKVIEALEELDDVQNVFSTLSISDEVMAQLEAA
jgi:transcriptional/translational regulatory protein YebC/TACO1